MKEKKLKKRDYTLEIALEELNECISSNNDVEKELDYNELVNALNNFLSKLSQGKRKISSKNKITESNTKTILLRLRNQLRNYLKEGGLYE